MAAISLPLVSPAVGRLPAPVPRAPGDDSPPAVCRKVLEELCVLANGDIVCSSCDVNGRWVFGNVHTDRLADVFNGPRYREMREWHLRSRPDSWCPAIDRHCPMRSAAPVAGERVDDCRVRVLKIEPVTHCNLHCPVCPVETHFVHDPEVRARRAKKVLPLETMIDVVEQLPDLHTLLYYNFGEPLLHKDTVPFLRAVRRLRPNCWLATNTNGIPLTPAVIEAIATEALFDKVVFSIDGATPESYRKYRVGGEWHRAMAKMAALVEACHKAGTRERVHIVWQYILFEWNDGDAELARAKELAAQLGVPLDWIVTNGDGASKRFTLGSEAIARLADGTTSVWHPAAHTKLVNRFEEELGQGALGVYKTVPVSCEVVSVSPAGAVNRAILRSEVAELTAPPGVTVALTIKVANRSGRPWGAGRPDGLRFRLRLRPPDKGRTVELPGSPLPAEAGAPDGQESVVLVTTLPDRPGEYQLLLDVVRAGTLFFRRRRSEVCALRVRAA